jgi:hypothetical protein
LYPERQCLKSAYDFGVDDDVAAERIDVSEESSASITRVTRIGELDKALAVNINRRTLRIDTM